MPMIDSISMGLDDTSSTKGSRIPDEVKRQLLAAQLLQKQAMDGSAPVYTPTLGWSKVAAAGLGGILEGLTEKREGAAQKASLANLAEAGFPSQTAAPASNASSGLGGMIAALFNGGDKTPDAPQPAAPEAKPTAFAPSDYATALAPDANLPRGIRNNNPLNIEAGDYTKSQPGFAGSDGRFAKFETPEQGTAAADKLLQTYATKYGLNTPAGIVGRWAPATDGNNVSAYAANVSKALGVDPNAPIDMNDPQVRSRLIAAMGQHENGRPIQMASLSPGQGAPQAAPQGAPQPQLAQNVPPQQPMQQQAVPLDDARRAALKKVVADPRVDPKIQAWALQQLSPSIELQKGADGTLYSVDKNNPGAGLRPVGKLPVETFSTATTPEGEMAQKSNVSGKFEGLPKKESSQSDVEYAQKNWKVLHLPDPNSPDPKDASFWRDYSAKRLGGAGVNVNVENKAEGAEAAERGKGAAKRLNDIADDNQAASTDIAHIGRLRSLMSAVDPGTRTALLEGIRSSTGIALDPNTDNVQAAKAITEYMVPRMRVAGTGASSDRDMNAFRSSLPTLMATPGGNQLVMDTLQGMAELRKARADIAVNYQVGEISSKEAHKQMSALPDPFAQFKDATANSAPAAQAAPAAPASTQSAPVKVASPSDARKLPSGTRIILPDGSPGVVP